MKTSLEILDTIISYCGDGWKRKLNDFLGNVDESGEEEQELFEDFLDAYKENILSDNRTVLEGVKERIDNELLIDRLEEYMEERLEAYYAIAPLRILEIKDEGKALALIDAVFNEAILRTSLEIEEKYKEFMLEDEQEMADIVGVLDSMCTFVVSKNLNEKAMEGVIRYNIRLTQKTSKYIAQKINNNFEELKTKIILQKLFSK